jgi:hypothetical protein
MAPAFGSIAIGGRHSCGGGGFAEAPGSMITMDGVLFSGDFMKKSGAKIILYS